MCWVQTGIFWCFWDTNKVLIFLFEHFFARFCDIIKGKSLHFIQVMTNMNFNMVRVITQQLVKFIEGVKAVKNIVPQILN